AEIGQIPLACSTSVMISSVATVCSGDIDIVSTASTREINKTKYTFQTGVAFGIFNKIPGGSSDLNTTTTKKKTLPFRSGLPITVFQEGDCLRVE
ncbi:hypothetical protein RUM43_002397, partial [Polyplax serrata]